MALSDGRALAAGVLASEAGVAASTASDHLRQLVDGGMLTVEQHGRHRYYRLANPEIASLLEQLAALVPVEPVRSLRQSTRAHALRVGRTCFDHLAGRLGVAVLGSLLDRGVLEGHDGSFRPGIDNLSAAGPDIVYRLTEFGRDQLTAFGIVCEPETRRPVIRHCVDWSEQRHHLSGHLGAAIASRLFDLQWIERSKVPRAVRVTEAGERGLHEQFGLDSSAYA